MQRNSKPFAWRPKGVSDTIDSSDSFKGAMAALTNLIPDPTTSNLFQCRPASIKLTSFASFTTPGFISCLRIVGNLAYGLIASGRNAGHDEPFCYNLATNAFVTVSGITSANTPASPLSSGAWVPPQMALIGVDLVVTHPGFSGAGGVFFGWFDITTPTAPVWHGGNLTGLVQFTVVPSAVAQYNARAYYIHNAVQPAVIFSDPLNALNTTNANQVLTFGDNLNLTALGGLQLNNQLGGIVQSLMVFKGVSNIYQITGDAAINSLSVNALNTVTGTFAPNTVVSTPKGLAFVAPDGLRVINFQATISDPIGLDGKGVVNPFITSVIPSRMSAGCNGNILRISTQNGAVAGTPIQDFWYDFGRQIWTGPHNFPPALAQPWMNTFVITVGAMPALWQSDPVQSLTSGFVENGVQMTFTYQTSFLPDTDLMTTNAMTETVVDLAFGAGASSLNGTLLDQNNGVMDTVTLSQTTLGTFWGSFTWGAAVWAGQVNNLTPYQLPWHQPIVFVRMNLLVTGLSAQGVKLGATHFRYQPLKYISNSLAAA